MLVLSRKEGERIVIGDQITLIVSRVSGNRVTIGIEAPRDVKITRGELMFDSESVEAPVHESGTVAGEEVCTRAGRSTTKSGALANKSGALANKSGALANKSGALREFAASVLPLQRQVG